MGKKATLLDIIEQKRKQGNDDKLEIKFYYSKTLDMDIEIRKGKLSAFLATSEELDEQDASTLEILNTHIFNHCPMFKENTKEALEIYGAAEPTELPSLVLEDNLGEMNDITEIINGFYGIYKEKKKDKEDEGNETDKTIKN